MAVTSVTPQTVAPQAPPGRAPQISKAPEKVDKPAERIAAPLPPPPQQAAPQPAPTVNTSGQKIGGTINTSA